MRVRVELSTSLRRFVPSYDPQHGMEVELPPGADCLGLLEVLKIPAHEVTAFMVGRRAADPRRPLKHGDLVGLFPALGGG